MTFAFQRNEARQCSRCGTALEDPASEERGVGPVCAKKDTALFSRTIPANYAGATAVLLAIPSELLPEAVQERYAAMKSKVFARSQRANMANEDIASIHLTGQDLRPIIKELDWILSHRMDPQHRRRLVNVVKLLGYGELAAVLSQEASTTAAPLWFQNGRVFLKGKSCRPGLLAIRGIPGAHFPRYRGADQLFSAPANQAEKFLEVVTNFWPLYNVVTPQQKVIPDGTLDTIRQQAQEWLQAQEAANPTPVAVPAPAAAPTVPAGPIVTICQRTMTTGKLQGEAIQVSFQWLFEHTDQMYALVAKLKEIPKQERSYDKTSKSWLFLSKHKEKVVEAMLPLFAIQEMSEAPL